MPTNQIFDAAIEVLHKRPGAVIQSMQDFVKPYDQFEAVAKVIYTGQMGLCELVEYLRAEFGESMADKRVQMSDKLADSR